MRPIIDHLLYIHTHMHSHKYLNIYSLTLPTTALDTSTVPNTHLHTHLSAQVFAQKLINGQLLFCSTWSKYASCNSSRTTTDKSNRSVAHCFHCVPEEANLKFMSTCGSVCYNSILVFKFCPCFYMLLSRHAT